MWVYLILESLEGFKYASNFKRGLASIQTLDGKWGYIDNTGEFVIEPK